MKNAVAADVDSRVDEIIRGILASPHDAPVREKIVENQQAKAGR